MGHRRVGKSCNRLLLSFFSLSAALSATPPSVSAVKIETPPILDGHVTDEEWGAAATASDFVQQRPALGRPATENTEIRFLYTEDALYIGVICFDSETGQDRGYPEPKGR